MYPWEPFGYKTAWIAARDCSPEALADALELTRVRETSPTDAINGPTDRLTLAVLPPVPGVDGMWTLATGDVFFDIDAATLAALSQRLGTPVQQFGTHRVSEYHLWALAENGHLVRQYRFNGSDGELEAWTGRPTPAEVALGLPDVAEFATEDDAWEGASHVNEDTVIGLAAAWSADPMGFEDILLDRPALVCLEPDDINAAGRGHDPGGPVPSRFARPRRDADADLDDESEAEDTGTTDHHEPHDDQRGHSASAGPSVVDQVVTEVVEAALKRLFGRR